MNVRPRCIAKDIFAIPGINGVCAAARAADRDGGSEAEPQAATWIHKPTVPKPV